MAISGYFVFGSLLDGNDTILTTLVKYVHIPFTKYLVAGGNVLMVVHFTTALPIFLIVFYNFVEDRTSINMYLERIVIYVIILAISLAFPYFTDMLSIMTDISVTLCVYILPCVCYWKLLNPHPVEKVLMVFVIVFGVFGSVTGLYAGITNLIENISQHPLDELFSHLIYVHAPQNASQCLSFVS